MESKNKKQKEPGINNPYFHSTFWIAVVIILTAVFGRSWQNNLHAFYFISLLLPVVIATSYFLNYFLVPRYLLKKRYFWFALYFFYTLVVSLYLEMLVLIFSFMYLVNFEFQNLAPNSSDTLLLAVLMYLVVFSGSFLLMVQQLFMSRKELEHLITEQQKMEQPFLELMSKRKVVRIPYENIAYIESLADYVKVHVTNGGSITSKERIGALHEKLPDSFIRIHRSFIVNKANIKSFTNNEVEVNSMFLTISRSFKKQVQLKLNSK